DPALGLLDRGTSGSRDRIAGAIEHLALVEAFLLVVVDPCAGLDGEAVGHVPGQLAVERKAGGLEPLSVVRREALEHAWIVRQGAAQVPAAGIAALLFEPLGIDALPEAERPDHHIESIARIVVAQFLRILVLLR